MRIDVHSHLIPEAVHDEWAAAGVSLMGLRDADSGPRQFGDFENEQLYSVERRLRDMDHQGIDMHVLSTPPIWFYNRPAAEGLAMCRRVNDVLAGIAAANKQRFVAICNLPLQAPEDAARELERCVRDNDMRGVEICSQVNGKNLDEPELAPFYAKAQELDVPIFIHPSGVPGLQDRLGKYYLTNLIGNPMDTTIAAASLVFGGVFKAFPRLKVYLAHGGGACPYIRGRWDHGWKVRPEGKASIERPPSEYFRCLYFDSLTHGGSQLSFLVGSVGAERIMLGTDYPFDMGNYNSVLAIDGVAAASDAEKELMLGGNAQRLFKIG